MNQIEKLVDDTLEAIKVLEEREDKTNLDFKRRGLLMSLAQSAQKLPVETVVSKPRVHPGDSVCESCEG